MGACESSSCGGLSRQMDARNEEVYAEVRQCFCALTRGLIPAVQLSLAKACQPHAISVPLQIEVVHPSA